MANGKDLITEEIKPHRILREVYRNFRQFQEFVSATGKDVIEHGYWIYNEDGTQNRKVSITISYTDLLDRLNELSDRKLEAMVYNVIMDMKQKDVAEIMKITTVSVGQYVDAACEQLAPGYFAEDGQISQPVARRDPKRIARLVAKAERARKLPKGETSVRHSRTGRNGTATNGANGSSL
jgi:hypothetical protein